MLFFRFSNIKNVQTLILLISIVPFCEMSAKKIMSVDFEVYGVVQGVFFRKHTQQQAKSLKLKGWCMNTPKGTVQGVMQGDDKSINEMKKWLQYTGSPSSKIDHADFHNEKSVPVSEFSDFKIRR